MLNVINLLKTHIYDSWSETDPPKENIEWTSSYSESEKSKAYPQINIDQIPEVRSRKTFVTEGVYRVEEEVLVTVMVRPDNNIDAIIDAAETTFRKMKTEVDKILNAGRYSIAGVRKVDGEGWINKTDREIKGRIVFKASQIVKLTYYEGS